MQEQKYSRLTLDERKSIEYGLTHGDSLKSIAGGLSRGTSTISREIMRNSFFKQTGASHNPFNNCIHRDICGEDHLCSKEDCRREYCCGCKFCFFVCKKYERENCPRLAKAPYVCNGCGNRRKCTLEKAFCNARKADRSAQAVLKDSRSGIDVTEDERRRLDSIVSPLIFKGQSPYHIWESNKDSLMISEKTIYTYIAAGMFRAKSTDLRCKVKMKPRKKKAQPKIEKACREGRTYREYLDFMEKHPDTPVVEMDTVIGAKGRGEKVMLTLHFPKPELVLIFLRDANTARSVTEIFDELKKKLGYNNFTGLFPVLLTDNGAEFSAPSAIETDSDGLMWTRVFCCDPNCSYQKPHIENVHRLIRMALPKGKSLNDLTQDDMDLLVQHINSYRRRSLGGRTPIEVFVDFYGEKILKQLGIRDILCNEINLTPSLLK
jgi:IS30 family transposase